jgi:hypothetical protein
MKSWLEWVRARRPTSLKAAFTESLAWLAPILTD